MWKWQARSVARLQFTNRAVIQMVMAKDLKDHQSQQKQARQLKRLLFWEAFGKLVVLDPVARLPFRMLSHRKLHHHLRRLLGGGSHPTDMAGVLLLGLEIVRQHKHSQPHLLLRPRICPVLKQMLGKLPWRVVASLLAVVGDLVFLKWSREVRMSRDLVLESYHLHHLFLLPSMTALCLTVLRSARDLMSLLWPMLLLNWTTLSCMGLAPSRHFLKAMKYHALAKMMETGERLQARQ